MQAEEIMEKFSINADATVEQNESYVMTADRCPEYDRLLKILKETKWIGGASGG